MVLPVSALPVEPPLSVLVSLPPASLLKLVDRLWHLPPTQGEPLQSATVAQVFDVQTPPVHCMSLFGQSESMPQVIAWAVPPPVLSAPHAPISRAASAKPNCFTANCLDCR